jgi:sarcosine oxidase subunit beta
MITKDVVILGAGIAGVATAEHLLRFEPGLDVLLADPEHVGAGSTSRSAAAFRHQWSVPAHVAFSRYSGEDYERLAAQGHGVRFRRNGYLFLYTDSGRFDQAARRAAKQRELGVEVEVLRPAEIAARSPCGSSIHLEDLVGATWGAQDGFLDPLGVAQAYLDLARERGLVYRPGLQVTGLDTHAGPARAGSIREGARVTGVRFGSDTVATERVVLAAGIWSPSVAARFGLTIPLHPAKRYIYHSRPLRGISVAEWPLLIGDRGQHCRPSEGNTLMMAWEARPKPMDACPEPGTLWDLQDTIEPGFGCNEYGLEVLEALARHVPVLAEEVSLHRATCGWYADTQDGKAILGPDPRLAGLYLATGFSGHGIMHGGATGLVLAELLLGREPSLLGRDVLDREFGLAPLLAGRPRLPREEMGL